MPPQSTNAGTREGTLPTSSVDVDLEPDVVEVVKKLVFAVAARSDHVGLARELSRVGEAFDLIAKE